MQDHPIFPTMETRHAERVAELRARGLNALADSCETAKRAATEAFIMALPHEPEPPARQRLTWRWVLAFLVSLSIGLGGVYAQAAHAATPTRCGVAEDDPAWSWSECGNLSRGVILTNAPKRCTGEYYVKGCTTIVDAAQYCHLRRHHRIDLTRTPHVKGDGYAKRNGCNPNLYAQDA